LAKPVVDHEHRSTLIKLNFYWTGLTIYEEGSETLPDRYFWLGLFVFGFLGAVFADSTGGSFPLYRIGTLIPAFAARPIANNEDWQSLPEV